MLRDNDVHSFEFGMPGEMRERLTDLVIQGRKRATAGLLAAFVLFGWVMLSTGALAMSATRMSTLAHVWAPFVGWHSSDSVTGEAPWIAGGSPVWHLAYITALCGLAATAAMLHDAWGTQRARLIRVFVLVSVLALASLALAVAADPTRVPL